jgi:hypothetical protein
VSIRVAVDKYGNPHERTTIRQFGDDITSKTAIEERIRRAQLAILNPSTPADDFLTNSLPYSQTNESRFSKNSIILDISGPVDDLAFVDLPGPCHVKSCYFGVLLYFSGIIVSGSTDGDERDIEDVEALVGSHIEKPNCLILLVVTCESEQTRCSPRWILIPLQLTPKINEGAISQKNMTLVVNGPSVGRTSSVLATANNRVSRPHQTRPD